MGLHAFLSTAFHHHLGGAAPATALISGDGERNGFGMPAPYSYIRYHFGSISHDDTAADNYYRLNTFPQTFGSG